MMIEDLFEAIRDRRPLYSGPDARARMLAGLPVTERRVSLGGVSTAVHEGGEVRHSCCCTAGSNVAARSGRRWSPGWPSATG